MQYGMIYNKFALSWVFSLLMFICSAALADGNNYQYSLQQTGEQYNPWVIPQTPEDRSGFQQPPKYQNQQNQGQSSQNRTYQRDRFVTDEFLESLRRQQSQHQVMPENNRYYQSAPRQSMPQLPGSSLPGSSLPGSGAPSYPSYGADYLNPLYDTPVITPWTPWDIGLDAW